MNKPKLMNPVQLVSETAPVQPLSEFKNQFLSPIKKSEIFHGFSQPKTRSNIIKINKAKLPPDFFPKSSSIEKRLPNFKLNLKQPSIQSRFSKPRRAQSERLHVSPQKTSFFGFFDSSQEHNTLIQNRTINSSKKIEFRRKFQTRQQNKRQKQHNVQTKRRFTPSSYTFHPTRGDMLLDLFPATYDQQMTEIIISNSSSRVAKFSPRKQKRSLFKQQHPSPNQNPIIDPQKQQCKKSLLYDQQYSQTLDHQQNNNSLNNFNNSNNSSSFGYDVLPATGQKKNVIQLKNIEKSNQLPASSGKLDYTFCNVNGGSQTVDLHNMTFFNAKSSYLPPIKK